MSRKTTAASRHKPPESLSSLLPFGISSYSTWVRTSTVSLPLLCTGRGRPPLPTLSSRAKPPETRGERIRREEGDSQRDRGEKGRREMRVSWIIHSVGTRIQSSGVKLQVSEASGGGLRAHANCRFGEKCHCFGSVQPHRCLYTRPSVRTRPLNPLEPCNLAPNLPATRAGHTSVAQNTSTVLHRHLE
jgi:hypothetical protein